MSHKSESEEDSDLEQNMLKAHHKKPHFTTMPRPQEVKRKKVELNEEDYEFDSDEGEMVLKPEKAEQLAEVESEEEEVEEDDFQRQLRLEREEAERLKIAQKEEKKTRTDPDGTEYEWDPVVKGWFPKIPDKKFIEYQQTSYAAQYNKPLPNKYYLFNGAFFKWDFDNNKWVSADTAVYAYIDYMTGISYEWNQEAKQWQPTPGQSAVQTQPEEVNTGVAAASTKPAESAVDKNSKKREGWVDVNEERNTNVYVSNLPLDITDEEFEEMMSKYGIIMKDPSTNKLKIKLYRENDEVKGDGRCCYLMPESVQLCLTLLDGSDYKGKKIKVEKAKFELKGTYDPSKAKTTEQIRKLNKKKEKELIKKQRQRLLDWEERPEIQRQKYEKVVVIKGLFSLEDIKKDPSLKKKLKEELNKELKTYGDVKKVLIHDAHPDGIATISFKEVEMADECVDYLNNRVWKNGRVITCETWDGKTKYVVEETEEETNRRIEEWHRFLESDD